MVFTSCVALVQIYSELPLNEGCRQAQMYVSFYNIFILTEVVLNCWW